jgi:RecA-family ATPase
LLLEVGTALISGAWGTYKTFIAIDLAKAVMLGTTFAGRKVMRQAGVLFIAAEGSAEIPIRLQAACQEEGKLPFAWVEDCPRLLDRGALKILVAMAKAAHKKMMRDFNLPLGLVIIDTMAASAGFNDEASNAEAQTVMNVLTSLAKQMKVLSVTVDHFGKNADSGTRGASAKEASVDGVLAVLGDHDTSGKVTNTKLVARKVRGGVTGVEFAFNKRVASISAPIPRRTSRSAPASSTGAIQKRPHPASALGQII